MEHSLTAKVMRTLGCAFVGKRNRSQRFRLDRAGLGSGDHLFAQRALNVLTIGWLSTGRNVLSVLCAKLSTCCPQTLSLTWHHAESQEPRPERSEPLLPRAATGYVTSGQSLVNWHLSFRVFVSKVWIPSLPESLEADFGTLDLRSLTTYPRS